MTAAAQRPLVPLLDLQAQHRSIRDEVRAAIDRVLERQRFILGEEVAAFEAEFASLLGSEDGSSELHVVGVSSGTDALLASLMALGIGPGDEVVTTPFTFVSTVESIVRLGARPVYVDLQAEDFHPSIEAITASVTSRTRAILFVHLYGACVDLRRLRRAADSRGIALVEDAAQAVMATHGGVPAGTFGTLGTFSFFPSKNLGAYGDAGAVVTRDGQLAARVRALRNHGQLSKYDARHVGGNFRLDEIQAAVLRAKLPHLADWTERRRAHARRYHGTLARAAAGLADGELVLPTPRPDEAHTFHQFVIRCPNRDALRSHLTARGVGTEIYYPRPMHRQQAWPDSIDLPEADRAAREALSIPVHPELTGDQLLTVEEACVDFFVRRGA